MILIDHHLYHTTMKSLQTEICVINCYIFSVCDSILFLGMTVSRERETNTYSKPEI